MFKAKYHYCMYCHYPSTLTLSFPDAFCENNYDNKNVDNENYENQNNNIVENDDENESSHFNFLDYIHEANNNDTSSFTVIPNGSTVEVWVVPTKYNNNNNNTSTTTISTTTIIPRTQAVLGVIVYSKFVRCPLSRARKLHYDVCFPCWHDIVKEVRSEDIIRVIQ